MKEYISVKIGRFIEKIRKDKFCDDYSIMTATVSNGNIINSSITEWWMGARAIVALGGMFRHPNLHHVQMM